MSDIAALRIDLDGSVSEITLPVESRDQLRALYRQIGCHTVAVVRLAPRLDMWLDEEGLRLQDINFVASFMGSRLGQTGQVYCGPVVMTGGVDGSGQTLGLDRKRVAAVRDLVAIVVREIEDAADPDSTSARKAVPGDRR